MAVAAPWYSVPSKDTIRYSTLPSMLAVLKQKMKVQVNKAGRIHFTSDIWTSIVKQAYIFINRARKYVTLWLY